MAFNTTKAETRIGPRLLQIDFVIADTAGNSGIMDLGDAETITIKAVATGTAGTLALQGSNDGTTFAALPVAVSFAASGQAVIAATDLGFKHYRFNLSGGDGTTSWAVGVIARLAR